MYSYIVIDDEVIIRKGLIKKISDIKDSNYECVGEAENGLRGLELVKEKNPDIIITDMSNIMELSSSLKNIFFNKELSVEYQNMLSKREKIIQKSSKNLCITDQIVDYSYIVNPMIVNGDLIGSIVLLSKDTITNNDIIVVDIITKILTKYIEE